MPAHHELLIQRLLDHLPVGVKRCTGPGKNNYKLSEHLFAADDECLASVYHGGFNPHPNVKASGGDASCRHADVLAEILRLEFPAHRVSRIDVATDRRGEGLYERGEAVMREVWRQQRAMGRKLKDNRLGGSAPEDGRTYYLGSPSSPLRLRWYEKGKERYAQTGDPFWLDYFDLVRLELQVRPQKAGKSTAAMVEPEELYGCSEYARRVKQGVLGMSADPINLSVPRTSTQEGRMKNAVAQYGPTFLRQIEILGSPEAFTLDLLRRLGVAGEEAQQAA